MSRIKCTYHFKNSLQICFEFVICLKTMNMYLPIKLAFFEKQNKTKKTTTTIKPTKIKITPKI